MHSKIPDTKQGCRQQRDDHIQHNSACGVLGTHMWWRRNLIFLTHNNPPLSLIFSFSYLLIRVSSLSWRTVPPVCGKDIHNCSFRTRCTLIHASVQTHPFVRAHWTLQACLESVFPDTLPHTGHSWCMRAVQTLPPHLFQDMTEKKSSLW